MPDTILTRKLIFFAEQLFGNLDEVSIGHALIADALYLGLHNSYNNTSIVWTQFMEVVPSFQKFTVTADL